MPGRRLSATENQLKQWWEQRNFQSPVLKRIKVAGDPGLRGIRDLSIDFDYPLAVLCGRNGNGKTTLLALAALSFGGCDGHLPPNAARKPRVGEDFSYYTFRDFFFRGPNDPDITGVTITWEYEGPLLRQNGRPTTSPVVVRKRGEKWMHYERRPSKPVYYLGVARSIPSSEQRVLRSYFGSRATRVRRAPLSPEYRGYLEEIMMRTYGGAEVITASRYSVRSCESQGSAYSSFNMGAGEDIVIELLYALQEAPTGSLIVIEEIELGLHPEALKRLAERLQAIMRQKQFQVVVSTHSRDFLDAVPRQARVLIQRQGAVHEAIQAPTARFASGVMAGQVNPEAQIYCEDGFAERLIGTALTPELRRRVRVVPVGSKSELVRQVLFHQRAQFGELALVVWDGDVSDAEVRQFVQAGQIQGLDVARTNWMTLPGGTGPEEWVLGLLNCADGFGLLAAELGDTPQAAEELVGELRALGDPHDAGFELGQKRQIGPPEAEQKLINAARKLPNDPFGTVRETLEAVLDGNTRQSPAL